jgi:hypothetical protein
MSAGGWIFIIISWAVIIVLCVLTFGRTLGLKAGNFLAPLEIDTDKTRPPARRRKR